MTPDEIREARDKRPSDSELLRAILAELRAIRLLLIRESDAERRDKTDVIDYIMNPDLDKPLC